MVLLGDLDFILIADVPNNESMTAISLAVAAGGAIKTSRTTTLMTGAQAVEAMKKVADVAAVYRPANSNDRIHKLLGQR